MKKFRSKERAVILGLVLIFAGLIIRSMTFTEGGIISTILAVFILSVGVGFSFAGLFANDLITMSDVKKYMMVPLMITLTVLLFKKFDIQMPILQVFILFIINILFFKKEIKKHLKVNR